MVIPIDMTAKQAQYLLQDWGSNLGPTDFSESVYVSIRGVGTRVFRGCAYYEAENYLFVWTASESFCINKKDMGDLVIIPYNQETLVSLKKVT